MIVDDTHTHDTDSLDIVETFLESVSTLHSPLSTLEPGSRESGSDKTLVLR